MAAMMYNQNNVATEGGPYTSLLEKDVGNQLCRMLGYETSGATPGWGHITCVSEITPNTQNRAESW